MQRLNRCALPILTALLAGAACDDTAPQRLDARLTDASAADRTDTAPAVDGPLSKTDGPLSKTDGPLSKPDGQAAASPGPRPAPATPSGISVPSSIDATGATDVASAILTWVNGQPNGSTLIFPKGATYRLGKAIQLSGRSGLTFWGYGATLRTVGPGNTSGSSAFRLQSSKLIRILGFRIQGENKDAGTPQAYHPGSEYAMGVAMYEDNDDVEIADNHISHVFGDGVYINASAKPISDRYNIHHNLIELTGRQGIVPDDGNGKIQWNILRDIAMSCIDAEDQRVNEWGGNADLGPLVISNNLFERWMHFGSQAYYYTCHAIPMDYKAGNLVSMHDISIEDNTFTGGCVGPGNTFQQSNTDADISMWGDMPKSNIYIRRNVFTLPKVQQAGWAIRLNKVTGGEVSGNVMPGQTVQCNGCTGVVIK